MYLIYDIFTTILQFTDIHTTYQLCFVDKTLYQLCSKVHHLIPIIYNCNHIYNPYIHSDILDGFLNDISGNNIEYLKFIQHTFSSLLTNEKRIILLTGINNGKSTFMYLIERIFYLHKINDINKIKDVPYEPGKILLMDEHETLYLLPQSIEIKNSAILINNLTSLIDKRVINLVKKDNDVITIEFQTLYVNYITNNNHHKYIKYSIWHMIALFDNKSVSAFFNFLLEGI